jgi:hypothetical protein
MTKRQRVRRYARTKIRERGPENTAATGRAGSAVARLLRDVHSVHLESARCHREPMESGRPVFTSAVEVPGYSLTSNSPNHSSVLRAAEKGSRWMPYRLNRTSAGIATSPGEMSASLVATACRGRMQPSGAV